MKTIAGKERLTSRKVICKYGVMVPRKRSTGLRRVVGVQYSTQAGSKTVSYFDESLVRMEHPLVGMSDCFGSSLGGGQLIKRFRANVCELCGSSEGIVVHHVRALKKVVQKYSRHGKAPPVWVVVMMKIWRKALVVCQSCHVEIHSVLL